MSQYKARRLKQIRSQIEDVERAMDKNYDIVQSFRAIKKRGQQMIESADKMEKQYLGVHKHAALELDSLFVEIEELEKEMKKYTPEQVNQILLRKDGKLNDWLNRK